MVSGSCARYVFRRQIAVQRPTFRRPHSFTHLLTPYHSKQSLLSRRSKFHLQRKLSSFCLRSQSRRLINQLYQIMSKLLLESYDCARQQMLCYWSCFCYMGSCNSCCHPETRKLGYLAKAFRSSVNPFLLGD